MNSSNERKSRGRQKVNMVKMQNQSNLQVTFSKRRAGLFKKASELCTLCGAEAAMVVFSPAEKVYCFGHPNVKTVVDRLTDGMSPMESDPRSQLIIQAHRNSNIRELNLELTQVESLLRAEKRRAEEIEMVRKAGQMQRWFPTSLDDFNLEQLSMLKGSIMGFKKNLDVQVQKEMLSLANSTPFQLPPDKTENPSGFANSTPFQHQPDRTENPSGFSLGVGVNNNSCVPTFDVPNCSLESSDFSTYSNGAIGFSNGRMFAPNSSLTGEASNSDPISNSSNVGAHHLIRGNGLSNAMFFGGGTNNTSSSNILPTDARGFGFNIGHDFRPFL